MTGGPHRLPGKPGHLRELPPPPKLRPFKVGMRRCHICGDRTYAANYRCERRMRPSPCGDPRPHLHDRCTQCGVEWMTRTYENRGLWKKIEPYHDVILSFAVAAVIVAIAWIGLT